MKDSATLIDRIDESITAGDYDQAIEIAARLHKRKVFSHLYLLSRNAELARDLGQETLVRALQALRKGTYQSNGQFLAWLLRIARNLFIDNRRRGKKRVMLPLEREGGAAINFMHAEELDRQTRMINTEIREDLRTLIDRLPDEQKEVVIMRTYLQMSFREIAQATGVGLNTALGRMRYALIRMRKDAARRHLDLSGFRIAA